MVFSGRQYLYMIKRIPLFTLFLILGLALNTTSTHASIPKGVRVCHTYSSTIRYGQQDTGSITEVSDLQQTLNSQEYFDSANLGTGHFGPITLRAVKRFQIDHGIPGTGFVGPLTRTALNTSQTGCGIGESPATLYSASPTSASASTTISVRGFGFSKTNTILLDGFVAARDIPITSSVAISCTTDSSCHGGINQTITFVLQNYLSPYCPPGSMCPLYVRVAASGTYNLTVRNDAGVSTNGLPFTISE